MSECFPKSVRLRTRRHYQRLARGFDRYVGRCIIVEGCANQCSRTRLGITVSKRYGKAHDRNRFKRIVREAFRRCRVQLIPGLDLNVKPRTEAYQAKMPDILEELIRLVGKPNKG